MNRRTVVPIKLPEPDFSCYLRGDLFSRDTHEMLSNWTLPKVRKFRKLIFTLFYIVLLTFPVSALPVSQAKTTIEVKENRNKITVQVKGCKPLSNEELRAMLGPAFDETKMAYDDDGFDSLKRSMRLQNVLEDNDDDFDDGDDIENDDLLEDQLRDEAEVDTLSDKNGDKTSIGVRNKYFMRRKRTASLEDEKDDAVNSPHGKQFLYQNLVYETIRAKSRRKRSYKGIVKSTPPWKCRMDKFLRDLNEKNKEYFPKKIIDGECSQNKCFYGMYRCNPVRYTVKVLRKDPKDACRPVPLIGKNTTYEESWVIRREHVTVACECQYERRTSKRRRTKSRYKS